jgi:hypothetical protein
VISCASRAQVLVEHGSAVLNARDARDRSALHLAISTNVVLNLSIRVYDFFLPFFSFFFIVSLVF